MPRIRRHLIGNEADSAHRPHGMMRHGRPRSGVGMREEGPTRHGPDDAHDAPRARLPRRHDAVHRPPPRRTAAVTGRRERRGSWRVCSSPTSSWSRWSGLVVVGVDRARGRRGDRGPRDRVAPAGSLGPKLVQVARGDLRFGVVATFVLSIVATVTVAPSLAARRSACSGWTDRPRRSTRRPSW